MFKKKYVTGLFDIKASIPHPTRHPDSDTSKLCPEFVFIRNFPVGRTQPSTARIMKHTGGETTTSVGRYDTSLGDFRLGEDYDEVYPLADFRKIPLLLDNLCRTTEVQLTEAGVSENIKIVANFMYDFMHIKPFGYCNLETGILLINFLELKEEHPLLILFADDRAELLNALKRGKISETPETLEAFILHEQIKFFNREI